MKCKRQSMVVETLKITAPVSTLALSIVFVSFGLIAVQPACAANPVSTDSAHHTRQAAKPADSRLAKKRAAASLLSAPMQASMDDSESAQSDRAPAVAPGIDSNRMRARRFLKEGARLHRIGEYADAEQLFRQAVALDPNNADAFYNLGALAEGRGDIVEALSQYRAGLHIQPADKPLKEAVESMEGRLAAGQGIASMRGDADRHGNFNTQPNMFTNPNPLVHFSDPPVLGVTPPDSPEVSQSNDPPPIAPVDGNGPFQLQSTQNAALAGGSGYAGPGSYNVLNSSLPPTLQVSQPFRGRRVAGSTLGVALRVGMRAALSGTGLHCPACHFLRF